MVPIIVRPTENFRTGPARESLKATPASAIASLLPRQKKATRRHLIAVVHRVH
jgi:hypothetical protein